MSAPWTEFALPGDRLADAVAFLRGALADGTVTEGLFLRDLAAGGRLLVQVRAAGESAFEPASEVPLAGPVFSGAGLAPVTRGFLARFTPVLLEALPEDRTAMMAAALDLMAAHLPAVSRRAAPGGPPLSFLSFRSHAEAFFVTSRDPVATRGAMDERYAAVRESVEERVGAVFAQVAGEGPVVAPAAQAWYELATGDKPAIAERFRAGDIRAHTEYAGDHLRERDDFAGSRFHRIAGASADLQDYLGGDPEFLATRLLTSLLYLTLHNIGLSLVERYFLCHVTSRACEAIYGVESEAVLAGLTAGRTPGR
ncbi:hypothetical protein ACTG9Q_25595 [Actinokineospora sp. 24-640]